MPRTMRAQYLSEVPLDDKFYKADLEVVDRYQAFSTELLRLSLLGIAGYGFLLSQIVFKSTESKLFLARLEEGRFLLALGLLALGVAVVSALMHRFYSTDCITHHIRFLRLHGRAEETLSSPTDRDKWLAKAEQERTSLEKDLEMCKWSLLVSGIALCVGAMAVALIFARTILDSAS